MGIFGVSGIGGISLSQLAQAFREQLTGLTASGTAGPGALDPGTAARGADFASVIGDGLSAVDTLDRTAAGKAVQAATGDLTDVHDYVIAATKAQTATELTTTLRNKALEAFSEIMRMPL